MVTCNFDFHEILLCMALNFKRLWSPAHDVNLRESIKNRECGSLHTACLHMRPTFFKQKVEKARQLKKVRPARWGS